jgi:hypothetical protein
MTNANSLKWAAFAVVAAALTTPTAALADTGNSDSTFAVVVVVVVLLGVVLAFIAVGNGLAKSTWSLADALSEEADLTPESPTSGAPAPAVGAPPPGRPTTVSELRASSSRLIALVGAIAITFVFLGFGAVALYKYATGQSIPDVDNVLKFLAGGAALFAPYAVNKISTVGSSGK